MNPQQPIFTEKAHCQDCYRCLRGCPVKAIKIEEGSASVVDELCIHCGSCVNTCPGGAKRVRDDRTRVRELLASGKRVIASLAPSYVAEFRDRDPATIIAALRRRGFYGVSETALGAEEVSAHVADLIDNREPGLWISSACPVVVRYIRNYRPALARSLTPFLSPLLAHCKLLKREFGRDTYVVFYGPCIAKKDEAYEHPDLLEAALTFEDLRELIDAAAIDGGAVSPAERFIPHAAEEGALYPIDGGMVASLRKQCPVCDHRTQHFSGLEEICAILDCIEKERPDRPLFLELLSCSGGCINGPRTRKEGGTLVRRLGVLERSVIDGAEIPRPVSIDIPAAYHSRELSAPIFSEEEIGSVLAKTGKLSRGDELNCGGCGYGNCRDFAQAVLSGKAETAMCVSYLRKLATKKANKLIMTMPSGVVIVDKNLRIIECNARFAALAGKDAVTIYKQRPGMGGAVLEKILPVSNLFRHIIEADDDILDRDLHLGTRVIHCSIFSIEPGTIAGGVFNDVTAPELQREEVIDRVQNVIRNNLTTVQKIAYLLGENASETEMLLSTIIESFKPLQPGDDDV